MTAGFEGAFLASFLRPPTIGNVYLRKLLLLQILRDGRLKVFGVAFVQAVDLAPLFDLHVLVHQDEFADGLHSRKDANQFFPFQSE